jgi:hypothetical protein
MEVFLPLATLVGLSGMILAASRKNNHTKEQFIQITHPNVAEAVSSSHTEFTESSASRYNPIANLMHPRRNTLLTPNYSNDELTQTEGNLRDALRSILANPNEPSVALKPSNPNNLRLNGDGTFQNILKKCEAVKTLDCNAFDDPLFATNCGMCHENGFDSSSNPISAGGLYTSDDDKLYAKTNAGRMGSTKINYTPTVGKCNPYRLTTTKEQCIRLKKQLECEKGQSFDFDGCSQCVQDQTFTYIDPSVQTTSPTLTLAGNGNVIVTKNGDRDPKNTINLKLSSYSEPSVFQINNFQEGDSLTIQVSPITNDTTSVKLAGYLEGNTASGIYRIDIIRLIDRDLISGQKPTLAGLLKIHDSNYTIMRPAKGQKSMSLILLNTFTFINPIEDEASKCASAPFLTKASSATFLSSGSCYKKGQGPGTYSKECLQDIFLGAGCSINGDGYPTSNTISDETKVSILTDRNTGVQLSNAQIASIIYEKSLQAYSGQASNGSQLNVSDWNSVSVWCTGREINNPCDGQEYGNYNSSCLQYLWQNQGIKDTGNKSLGSTYKNPFKLTSLNKNDPEYCTLQGLYSPIDTTGKVNEKNMNMWNSYGDVSSIQEEMDTIHKKANDNTLSDTERSDYLKQCYGITLNYNKKIIESKDLEKATSNLDNVLDTKHGRTQTPFEKMLPPKNYKIPYGYSVIPASVLGSFGDAPWGTNSDGGHISISYFPKDTQCKWIWANDDPNKKDNFASYEYISYSVFYLYTNESEKNETIILKNCVDIFGIIYLNNTRVSDVLSEYTSFTIQVPPGENMIEFLVSGAPWVNGHKKSGVCVLAVSSTTGKTLFRSDSSWKALVGPKKLLN